MASALTTMAVMAVTCDDVLLAVPAGRNAGKRRQQLITSQNLSSVSTPTLASEEQSFARTWSSMSWSFWPQTSAPLSSPPSSKATVLLQLF